MSRSKHEIDQQLRLSAFEWPTSQTTPGELRRLSIRTIDITKPAEKKMHDDLESLIAKCWSSTNRFKKFMLKVRKSLEHRIAAADKKIDELVNAL